LVEKRGSSVAWRLDDGGEEERKRRIRQSRAMGGKTRRE
jgi:hypothetical protein